jgi:hypothetical protein
MRVGAPLPEELSALPMPPTPDDVLAEIERAEVELMHAIARHRKAWGAMRRRQLHRLLYSQTPGAVAALESDPMWAKATGDVRWWREEMNAQAASLLALEQMRQRRVSRETEDTDGA